MVEFENPDFEVLSGVNAEIKVFVPTGSDAVVVNRRTVLREDSRYFVYVADGPVARKQDVSIGRAHGLDVEIVSGLKPGDVLITEGQMLLEEGAKINIVEEKRG
jgi:multidrug efflux pump subunit AcrA (membrane-fusion protein)